MGRFLTAVLVGGVAMTQVSLAGAQAAQKAGLQLPSRQNVASADLPPLPPPPKGTATVVGGVIRDIDPVLDEMTLKVFGGNAMKIDFDARTRVYLDGVKKPLSELRPQDHASVETVLDGNDVYALSVHMLSHVPEGQCEGQVLAYNPGSGVLTVSNSLTREPIRLTVPAGTPVVGVGQAASVAAERPSSGLMPGALVSVQFAANNHGQGIARKISLLAAPGSAFVFSGNVTFLNVAAGRLSVVDPRDGKSYDLVFDAARFPVTRGLHLGSHVMVTATFDGSRYVASAITAQ